MVLPVCIRSPTFNWDIVVKSPFSRDTLAVDGKQSHAQHSYLKKVQQCREQRQQPLLRDYKWNSI